MRLTQGKVGRHPEVSLQRWNLMALVAPVDHEHRRDQLGWVDAGFAHERP